jgi:hypothetical protein
VPVTVLVLCAGMVRGNAGEMPVNVAPLETVMLVTVTEVFPLFVRGIETVAWWDESSVMLAGHVGVKVAVSEQENLNIVMSQESVLVTGSPHTVAVPLTMKCTLFAGPL